MSRSIFSDEESNPEVKWKSAILIKIVWCVLVIVTLAFITNMFIQPEHIFRYSLILSFLLLFSIILSIYVQKGYAYIGAFVYVSFLLLMIFVFSFTGGGIKGHGIKILPVVVLIAGLTLGKKEIWLFGIIATLGGFALVLADYFQQIPVKEPLGQSPLIYWIYSTTGIFLLCFLENLSVEKLLKALDKTRKELELRKKSEEQLKTKNEKLREIAAFQSHLVRGPVASVLGLISLIRIDNPADPINSELIPKLAIAAKELDAVIHDIVRNTREIESLDIKA